MKKILVFTFIILILLVSGCQNENKIESVNSAEEVVKEFCLLSSAKGYSEIISNNYLKKDLSTGYLLQYIDINNKNYEEQLPLEQEFFSLCTEVDKYYNINSCTNPENIILKNKIISSELIEGNITNAKIKLKYENKLNFDDKFCNKTIIDKTYVLKKINQDWKIEDIINSEGVALSDNSLIQREIDNDKDLNELASKVEYMKNELSKIKIEIKRIEQQSKYDLLINISDLFDEFDNLTGLQKDKKIKEYQGKKIKTTISVSDIKKESLSTNYIVEQYYNYPYSPFTYVKVSFPNEEEDNLINVNIGNKITFIGEFATFNDGILVPNIYFKNSKFINANKT